MGRAGPGSLKRRRFAGQPREIKVSPERHHRAEKEPDHFRSLPAPTGHGLHRQPNKTEEGKSVNRPYDTRGVRITREMLQRHRNEHEDEQSGSFGEGTDL